VVSEGLVQTAPTVIQPGMVQAEAMGAMATATRAKVEARKQLE